MFDVSSAIIVSSGFTGNMDQICDDEAMKHCAADGSLLRGSFERSKNISECVFFCD